MVLIIDAANDYDNHKKEIPMYFLLKYVLITILLENLKYKVSILITTTLLLVN